MKVRDSGMPAEDYWESLLDVELILDRLGIGPQLTDVLEIGCGFGTFTIPAARRISGVVHALDIDPAMLSRTKIRAEQAGLTNIRCRQCDVMEQGRGLSASGVDAAFLFNILHCENPVALLAIAADAVRIGGSVFVVHWLHDARTPRGPDLSIRPRPEQVHAWADATGRLEADGPPMDLPPWHYGLKLRRITRTRAAERLAGSLPSDGGVVWW